MSFKLDKVTANRRAVQTDRGWFALEGRMFGNESSYPLRVFITTGGSKWGAAWKRGCSQYARRLKGHKARQDFNRQCQNPATMPTDAIATANREAINASGCLIKVAYCGPSFKERDDLNDWLNSGNAPKGVTGESFRLRSDGLLSFDVNAEPPAAWVADDEQISRLLEMDEFCEEVGTARRILEEEGPGAVESPEDEENLGNGPTSKPPSTDSQTTSEKHSES